MKKLLLAIIVCLCLTKATEAQWEPHKPVYILPNYSYILDANPNLYEYLHLTNHYFYRKPGPNGETYDYRSIDPRVYQTQYIDNNDRRYAPDRNHPWLYRDMILDLEMNPIWKTDDPDWWKWTQEYINIARMTRAIGKPVAIYGVYLQASEYQIWWNLGRWTWHLDPKLNPNYYDATDRQKDYWRKKLKEFQQKESNLLTKLGKIADRFQNEIDAPVLELYMGYEIDSMEYDSWKWYAWKYLVQQKVAAYSMAFPDKPIYVFIQPNFTVGWKPVPVDMWSANLEFIMSQPEVSRVYLFALPSKPKAEGWDQILIDGPK